MHRDIKPENIIFKKCNHQIDIGIIDFGFATVLEEYDHLFVRCGTPGYVAPEILNDLPYDFKVDVYSAGVIFYMMLTGRMPFSGDCYDDIVSKNQEGVIDFDF